MALATKVYEEAAKARQEENDDDDDDKKSKKKKKNKKDDIYGRLLQNNDLMSGSINLSDYSSGIYIIKILKDNHIIQTEKIIKK